MTHFKNAIIGGGVAAGFAAQTFADAELKPRDIAIFSGEGHPPYDRPPLSKGFLAGEEEVADTLINDTEFYADNHINLFLNSRVTDVDFDSRQLKTAQGTYSYDNLLIATGSQLRTLTDVPGADLRGIHYLRALGDARGIRSEIKITDCAVVIGGGFIGMEVASVLAQKGVETRLIFPEERVWEAFFTPEMSDFFTDYYKARGVTIRPNSEIERFSGEASRVTTVHLKDGTQLATDLVVAGIGVKPNITIFRGTNLNINDGIVVDRHLESNLPNVFAAGDVAEYEDVLYNKYRRVEHWDNAKTQGQHAARAMLGQREPFRHVPYFFSDVFDLSYEFWGDPAGADDAIHRGDIENGEFSVWWLRNGKLRSAFVMNRPNTEREQAQTWIKTQVRIDRDALLDADEPVPAAAR